jgi:two-component system LytT family response regulator
MVNTITRKENKSILFGNTREMVLMLSGVFVVIVGLTIFQDFLEAKRRGYAFYFNESLLFKTIWFLFIPILTLLYKKLKDEVLNTYGKTLLYIVLPIAGHLCLLPLISKILSILFYDGSYSLSKFFTYTLANDLYKIVMIYGSFVLGYKYFIHLKTSKSTSEVDSKQDTIIVHNGKTNNIVNVADIVKITSATPYVFIHLENRKYLHSLSLKSIGQQLNNRIFIQVHKTTVINILKVNSFKSRLNGDYDLQMITGEGVRLSRTYAANFKKHFNTSPRFNL